MMAQAGKHNAAPATEGADSERLALQRKRSIAIAVSLGVLVALFYVATLVKMRGMGENAKTPSAVSGAASGKAAKP